MFKTWGESRCSDDGQFAFGRVQHPKSKTFCPANERHGANR